MIKIDFSDAFVYPPQGALYSFQSIEDGLFMIGRGTVYIVRVEYVIDTRYLDRGAYINGKLFDIIGVEKFAKHREPDYRIEKGELIGLLTNPPTSTI